MKPILWLKKQTDSILAGSRRFPVTLAVILAAVAALVVSILRRDALSAAGIWPADGDDSVLDACRRTLMAAGLAFPLTLGAALLLERRAAGLAARAGALAGSIAAAALYAAFLIPDYRLVSNTRFALLAAASCLFMISAPHLFRKPGLPLTAAVRLIRLLVAALYSLVLMLSLFGILFTLDKLLGVPVKDVAYALVAAVVWTGFAPVFWIAGIPPVEREPAVQDIPKTLRFLLLYIVIPLLAVYTAILYAYTARLAFERSWPQGLVSTLMLSQSTITLLVLFLTKPLRAENPLADRFGRWFPRLSMPLFVVLFMALGIRLSEYGVTEARWFAVLLAVWCFGSMVYASISKRPRSMVWAVSLILFCVVSVVGPLAASPVSVRSQNARLERILAANGMLRDGKAVPSAGTVPDADRIQIADIVAWFGQNHDYAEARALPSGYGSNRALETFGFETAGSGGPPLHQQYAWFQASDAGAAVDITGFDALLRFDNAGTVAGTKKAGLRAAYDAGTGRLRIFDGEALLYERDMAATLMAMADKHPGTEGATLPQQELTFDDSGTGIDVRLVLSRLEGSADNGVPAKNSLYVEGFALVRRK